VEEGYEGGGKTRKIVSVCILPQGMRRRMEREKHTEIVTKNEAKQREEIVFLH
jgi:hypothetical protein